MITYFETPSLVKEISRKTGLVLSSSAFYERGSEPDDLSAYFYLANADNQEIITIRFEAVLIGTSVSFRDACYVVVETVDNSWFNQETKITITDDIKENHSVIVNMVAKILKTK